MYVKEKTAHLTKAEYDQGVTTQEIAEVLGIQRTNSSKDLNQLVREGKLIKTDGRPVRYIYQTLVTHVKPVTKHVVSYKETPVSEEKNTLQIDTKDIFAKIIGANGSMKNSVEQAKAAILYPPRGLNCLITGPTGSGKTYFAHAMYHFAKAHHVIDEETELIVFNCADYANNPELLMSHLFGYAKGAFTGADEEKMGIIDQADGGMLFLDEIHRLPPEGQEMIFYFMDHGTYSRLGETTKSHEANVRIVGATTEDPGSSLLETFVRRIPINIKLPAFEKRPANEKVDLVKIMIAHEANRTQRKISLTEDVAKALIGSVTYGNIGQLKSNIQLVCARGFLNHMQSPEISITIDDLTEGIRSGLIQLASNRSAMAELSKILEPKITVAPNDTIMKIQSDSYELPYNLYDIIGDKAALLKSDGLDQEAINHFISTDINIHLKSFYKDHGFSFNADSKLAEFVDPKIIEVTNQIYVMVKRSLQYEFQQNFIYAMSLHISSFLKKINLGEERHTNDNIREMAFDFPDEYAVAKEVRSYIETYFQVEIPESEDYYLTVLLVSLRANQASGRIGVVVAAHGNSTASSMVQVVQQLLDAENVRAVDMPLDMDPKTALDRIERNVQEVDEGSGVILLVDMGSLASFNSQIQRDTGIPVRTVDMVTTSLVLETVRKVSVLGTDLDMLHESLKNFRGYAEISSVESVQEAKPIHKKKAVLAICASGEGTAQRIKELIERAVNKRQETELEVLALSIVEVKEELPVIQKEYQIIATTGITDLNIQAPFIPLERFIDQNIEVILDQLLMESELEETEFIFLDEESAKNTCVEFISDNFIFINGSKLIDPMWQFSTQISQTTGIGDEEYGFKINLVMHTAGMIERIIRNESLTVEENELTNTTNDPLYSQLAASVVLLEDQIKVKVPIEEMYYLLRLVHNQLDKKEYTVP
ncbi:TPA: sigma 54-interacting transcriptional regulator [Enterococcus faecium]|uniref:sigma 54-interacting transcriptional regulator n=1 Tax=Enterococcus faecium TaxID=1352 RepID=UPI001555DF3D|nr:sigma-54-dependent transcriptional regulator [Enterococcus faecium]MBK4805402.1 transcriptional antiterminator bglG:Sigma-54 factor [Enterococcus faecium]MCG4569601.1 sigma 54-interacting transcriptional regulator [Enterococcus faecium]MDQ8316156.1 sigma 54-interacting transcriptional regulator [Enterococcus faecium]MDW2983685.1 sigma 54-interacting transcriptional regulator [Enterococcus faecium]MDW3028701.1 sigma 54-interacting transcriptional regulator [Enterococcus faecium]